MTRRIPSPKIPRRPRRPQQFVLRELCTHYQTIREIPPSERPILTSGKSVARYIAPLYQSLTVEQVGVLALDANGRPIAHRLIGRGPVDCVPASPREIFQAALLMDATAIVIVHNHPAGDPTPSDADDVLCQRLYLAGDMLRLPVADFVIIGATTATSHADGWKVIRL